MAQDIPLPGPRADPLITDAPLAVPLTAFGAAARGTIRAVSVFDRRPVFNLGPRHEVTACVGMRRGHAALDGAVPCTTRCRQRAGGRRCGRRDRWDCRRWPRRRNGGDRRRLGRRRDRRVQPPARLRLPLPRLCRAWRLPLDTGALQPFRRMAAGPLRTVLEGCFKGQSRILRSGDIDDHVGPCQMQRCQHDAAGENRHRPCRAGQSEVEFPGAIKRTVPTKPSRSFGPKWEDDSPPRAFLDVVRPARLRSVASIECHRVGTASQADLPNRRGRKFDQSGDIVCIAYLKSPAAGALFEKQGSGF